MQLILSSNYPQSERHGMLVLMSLSVLYHYMYCMMVSSMLSVSPVVGGALFLTARVGGMLIQWLWGKKRKYITKGMYIAGMAFLCVMLVVLFLLLAVFPFILSTYAMWILFSIVLLISLRESLAGRITGKMVRNGIGFRAYLWMMAGIYGISMGVGAVLLFPSMTQEYAWQSFGTLAMGALLEIYSLWRERNIVAEAGRSSPTDPGIVKNAIQELKDVGAYYSFDRFHTLILMALQMTLVMMYTFIGLTGRELLICLFIALGLTLLLPEAIGFFLRHMKNKKPAATKLLLAGLFIWIYGLILFYRQLGMESHLLITYLTLGMSVGGVTVSMTCLAELEDEMQSVARYGLQTEMRGYKQLRFIRNEMAVLLGQLVALVLLTVLSTPSWITLDGYHIQSLADDFRPIMILPPLLLLISAFVRVLHFPMNNRYFQKVRSFLTLKEEGEENPALQRQLDSVVMKRNKKRIGVKIIIMILRPLYYHKVLGTENLQPYEDGSMILVCNHGEIYGPIVANLYIPISFRPWVVAHMMEKEKIVDHMYHGSVKRQRWIPEKWKKPLIQMICPLLQWVFESIESIPVYRGNPRALLKTFRMTVEAMQAGDNILLFPENGEDRLDGQKGYAEEGVTAQLYTGFAMLAPAYYAKTGKRAVFMPVYASKRLRTLRIGEGIEYNPEAPANQEKLRIVDELLHRMNGLYEMELRETSQRKKKQLSE